MYMTQTATVPSLTDISTHDIRSGYIANLMKRAEIFAPKAKGGNGEVGVRLVIFVDFTNDFNNELRDAVRRELGSEANVRISTLEKIPEFQFNSGDVVIVETLISTPRGIERLEMELSLRHSKMAYAGIFTEPTQLLPTQLAGQMPPVNAGRANIALAD